jgi:hypothetical protein
LLSLALSLAENLSASSWRADSAARSSGDRAEAHVAVAGKFQRALLGAVAHLDLLRAARPNNRP